MRQILALVTLLCLSQPVFSQEDPLTGVFTNAEAQLSVTVRKSNDRYEGFILFQGQRYPFSGVKSLGMLSAEYAYQGNGVPFTLARLLGVYYLTSEGVSLEMARSQEQAVDQGTAAATTPVPSAKAPASAASTQAPAATGARVSDPFGGYSFQLPAGWKQASENAAFTLSNPAGEQVGGISTHNYRSLDEIRANVFDIEDADSQTSLKSKAQSYADKGLLIHYQGRSQGQPLIIEMISLVSPYGGGINIAWTSRTGKPLAENTAALKAIANSVQFVRPKASPLADQWKQRISGRQLLYLNTYNGGSDEATIDLCPSGEFAYSSNASYLSGNASENFSYADQGSNTGTWKVVANGSQAILMLYYSNGSVGEHALSNRQAGNEIGLNGKRYFIRASERCQ